MGDAAIPGIVAQEQATGVPWYETGALCTPSSCLENYYFPGAIAPLAPEGSGLPSFWAVLAFEVIFVGLAEAYRGGLTAPPKGFPSPADVGVYPGGRFDPFKFSEKVDMEEMKIKELKHCRLAMGAFLGCLAQQAYTASDPSRTSPRISPTRPTTSLAPRPLPGTCKHDASVGVEFSALLVVLSTVTIISDDSFRNRRRRRHLPTATAKFSLLPAVLILSLLPTLRIGSPATRAASHSSALARKEFLADCSPVSATNLANMLSGSRSIAAGESMRCNRPCSRQTTLSFSMMVLMRCAMVRIVRDAN